MNIIGLIFFGVPGTMLLALGLLFLFGRDMLWHRGRQIDGMIPEHFARSRQWDLQMIAIGVMLLMVGSLCIGLTLIGAVFR